VPPGGGWGGPGGLPPPANGFDQLRHESDIWFVISLVSIPCCCVFGIVGAVLAYQTKDLLAQHRIDEAKSKITAAKAVTLAGIGLGLLAVLSQVLLGVLSALW
jgi:hypothetical protein